MERGVLAPDIVGVVGCNQRNAGLFGNFDQLRVDCFLTFDPVILQFQIIVVFRKSIPVYLSSLQSLFIVTFQNKLRQFSGKAG
ncbi:hypothetical protein SDC9_152875 [bioreactor metagenome]|uniref:Uncharacterized protein n=1 Tax=bioreactor metagenome TaxID=1076179 RepID=A0A645EYZ8_9ZZZZ